MVSIFTYNDYRIFLSDYYKEKKESNADFSYQQLAKMAGFSSKSFIYNVLRGKKNLSQQSVVKIRNALKFSKTEAAFFENLVRFNQAESFLERKSYFEKLNAIYPVTTEASNARTLRKDQYEFYAKWYHVVVRSLVDMYPQITDTAVFAKMVRPPIKPKQVEKSLALLVRLKLIEKQKDGTYRISSKILSTGPDVECLAIQDFHLSCGELAARAIKEVPRKKRNISGLTLGISNKTYEKICKETFLYQEKILELAKNDAEADSVYQFNFQLFPVSAPLLPRPKGKSSGKNQTHSLDGTLGGLS
jgi:uncharacterized protein (TIGR02147 family)